MMCFFLDLSRGGMGKERGMGKGWMRLVDGNLLRRLVRGGEEFLEELKELPPLPVLSFCRIGDCGGRAPYSLEGVTTDRRKKILPLCGDHAAKIGFDDAWIINHLVGTHGFKKKEWVIYPPKSPD